jgi:hypothetical protein
VNDVNTVDGAAFAPQTYGDAASASTAGTYPAGKPIAAPSNAVSTGVPCWCCCHAVSAIRARLPDFSALARSDDDRWRAAFTDGSDPIASPCAQSNVSERGSGNAAPLKTTPAPASPAEALRSYATSRAGCQCTPRPVATLPLPLPPLTPARAVNVSRSFGLIRSTNPAARYAELCENANAPKPFVLVPSNCKP